MPSSSPVAVKTALLSVSDKSGLAEFATRLAGLGITLLSTGGTAKALRDAGLEVIDVSEVTGFPEIMDGRVKTLHPKIHGGLLAKRDDKTHADAAALQDISMIDLVVINLYPFAETFRSGADFESCIENIDIGGPAMIRASAKNHAFVSIVSDPTDYDAVATQLETAQSVPAVMRQELARKAFAMTASYDQMIADWLLSQNTHEKSAEMPEILSLSAPKILSLRYGENPHQQAGIYQTDANTPSVLSAQQIQGKALSYNNVNDTDAALRLVSEFDAPAIAIIKHAHPCGVAVADDPLSAWQHP